MATLLPMQTPFPSFVQARSRLLMEEIAANDRARLDGRPEATATALTIGQGSSSSSDRGSSKLGCLMDRVFGSCSSGC